MLNQKQFLPVLYVSIFFFLFPICSYSWDTNTCLLLFNGVNAYFGGTPIKMINDAQGGVIVGVSSSDRCYVQKVTANGVILWQPGGIPVSTSSTGQSFINIAPTGDGGCLVLWNENGARIQKIKPDGSWGLDSSGKQVSLFNNSSTNAVATVPDCNNGLICFGYDTGLYSVDKGLYAQKINQNGDFCWDTGGVYMGKSYGGEVSFAADEKGGALVAGRSGSPMTIRYQHIDSTGRPCWTYGGVTISPTTTYSGFPNTMYYGFPRILPDGADGAVLTWEYAFGNPGYLLTQHISSTGQLLFTGNGLTLSTTIQAHNSSINFNFWKDSLNNFYTIWYPFGMQRYNSDGQLSWQEYGISVVTSTTYKPYRYAATGDDFGNFITLTGDSNYPLKVQKIGPSGNLIWGDNGITPWEVYPTYQAILSDQLGGAFLLWESGSQNSVYVRRIYHDGQFTSDVSVPSHYWEILE